MSKKILITNKKEQLLVYVINKKEELFESLYKTAVADCMKCGDKKGLIVHI